MKGRLVAMWYNAREAMTPELHVSLRTFDDKYDFVIDSPIYPYCFADLNEIAGYENFLKKLGATVEIEKQAKIYQKDSAVPVRLTFDDPYKVKMIRNILQKKRINVYEADIPFQSRVMLDLGLRTNIEVSDGRLLNATGDLPKPRVLYFDTETDDSEGFSEYGTQAILAYGCIDGQTGEERAICNDSEIETIREFIEFGKDYDILVEYTDFDSETLLNRTRRLGLPFRRDQLEFLDFKAIYQIRSMREDENYTLDSVAKKYLGIKIPRASSYSELFKHNREHLKNIVTAHARVLYLLEKELGLIEQTVNLCDRYGLLPSDGTYAHKFTDMAIMGELLKYKPRIIVPCRKPLDAEERESYKGALVLEPQTGIWHNVVKLDFVSMYPTIMFTTNISPEYYDSSLGSDLDAIVKHCSNKEIGIVQKVLERGLAMRMEYRKAMKVYEEEGKKFTYEWKVAYRQDYFAKVLINAIYGSYGEVSSRFYTREFAEIITRLGRNLLEETKRFISTLGDYSVLYGDTDAVFVLTNKRLDECESEGKRLQQELNAKCYPVFLNNLGIPTEKHKARIEFSDIYTDLLLVEKKKRYAGIIVGQKEPEIVGFESVRSDWCQEAKDMQDKVLIMILSNNKQDAIISYIKEAKDSILSGSLNSKLVLSKGLRHKPSQYKAIKKGHRPPPHVRAALVLQESGETIRIGKIAYVYSSYRKGNLEVSPVVDATKVPSIDNTGLEYYWRHACFPCVERILEVIGVDETKLKELRIVPKSQQLDKIIGVF